MNHKSIAVLPFLNMSPDRDDEYFSDGITEEIILALSGIRHLKVTARTSSFAFKHKSMDVRSIGKDLGVSTVLEGSIRKAGDQVRISVQLARTDNGFRIWSAKFDRRLVDIFKLQEEISLLVADKIRENFGHIELYPTLIDETSGNIDAYDFYLRGRFEQLKWTNKALERAIAYYKKCIDLDPEYSRAYYGIVLSYIYKVFWSSEGKDTDGVYSYLSKAAEVSQRKSDYYLAKASADIMIEWNYESGIKNFRKLLELNPNNPEALEAIAGLYIMVGEFKEALKHIDRALEMNPLSLNHTFMKGNILYFAGKYQKAIRQMNLVLQQDPKWMFAVQLKAAALILTGQRAALDDLLEDYSDYDFMIHYQTLYLLYHQKQIEDYTLPFQSEETIHAWQLYFYTLEEKYDAAFSMLKNGLEQKHGKYVCFNYDPFLVKLRNQKRFKSLQGFIPERLPCLSNLYDEPSGSKPLITDRSERVKLLDALEKIILTDQVFLDPDLSLQKLADLLNTTSNKLSWIINEEKDVNFNEFINNHRLEYFKELALKSSSRNLTLLALAFESGFSSKSTFNDFFKKKTGQTPRSWLKSH